MATISFYNTYGSTELDAGGSGLGFFGSAGFGSSVSVGSYQDTTFVTNSGGTVNGATANNVKYIAAGTCSVNGGSTIPLQYVPNIQSTLNIRFTHTSAVQIQNVKLRAYNRSDINVAPSSVVTQAFYTWHQSQSTGVLGSGYPVWASIGGSGAGNILDLPSSPTTSGGAIASGSTSADTRHDYYICLSQSPSTVASKYSALYVSLEYL